MTTLAQQPPIKLFEKQEHAVWYLTQPWIREVLYGGAAGGGKTAFGCLWIISNATKFAGTRWLIARASKTSLRDSTLVTFVDMINKLGLAGQATWHDQGMYFSFTNGSVVNFREAKYYPSDPHYSKLGSTEYTGAFLDEVNEMRSKARDIVLSRLRYRLLDFDISGEKTADMQIVERNDKGVAVTWRKKDGTITRGLTPKLFMSCNPDVGWLRDEFHDPAKSGKLLKKRAFIQALPTDNPYLSQEYLDTLLGLNEQDKQRLYYGNWDYFKNDNWLIRSFDYVKDIFGNQSAKRGEMCLTIDAARFGDDDAQLTVWDGWNIIDQSVFEISETTLIASEARNLQRKYSIANSNIVVDSDGVGGGVADLLPGCYNFVNNSSPIKLDGQHENYNNLKSQCAFYLADRINAREMGCELSLGKDFITQLQKELFVLNKQQSDLNSKLSIITKAEMKTKLNGQSPNILDTAIMRSVLDLKPAPRRGAKRVA